MNRFLAIAVAAVALAGFAGSPVLAKSCRDAHGKFIACPKAVTVPAPRCRNAKGKFTKCPATTK